jgi:hypothetical protein
MPVKHPGFYVWNPEGRYPNYTHMTLRAASDEAKRLAAQNPGKQFFVMAPAAVAQSEVSPVVFGLVDATQPDADDLDAMIPF